MLDFLLASQNLPFTVSLTVMLALAVLEGITTVLGMGISGFIDGLIPDVDVDLDVDFDGADSVSPGATSKLLSWIRVGQVPAIVLLIVFLTSFGLTGLGLQSFAEKVFNTLLPGSIAGILTLIISMPVVRVVGGILGRLVPKDETDAVSTKSFIGRVAFIRIGRASFGSPAEAKLRDKHRRTHYLMVEPDNPKEVFDEGTGVVLVSQDGAIYKAIRNTKDVLVD